MDSKLDELKHKVESNITDGIAETKTPLSEAIKPVRKGINGWLISGVALVLLAGISIVPVQGANLLGSALNLVGLNQAAAGADLLANKGVGAALGALQFDPTKPEQCVKLWDIIKTTKINQPQINNSDTQISVSYSPEGNNLFEGLLHIVDDSSKSNDSRVL
jgi:hypothetical protein